ncbi:MAG: sulfatase [Elusimicrobia bacterium]|nr:sulfatase [Elusimicrobiota bacterium]
MNVLKPLFCAVLFACPAAAAARPELNVVLISLNALRADHLKTYGYGKETAPAIGRLAAEGTVFEQAVAQSNWTLPSLVSLFTSRYVRSHGVYQRGQKVPPGLVTLAQALKNAGYRTAAFTGGLDMSAAYGLDRGFDLYSDDAGGKAIGSFSEIMPKALDWLAASRDSRFFLFLDSYDIHPPFDKPWPGGSEPAYAGQLKGKTLDYSLLCGVDEGTLKLSAEDLEYISARYDAGVSYADGYIGSLLAKLEELHLSTGTIVIFASEHGEELGEHGSFDRFGRGSLYEATVRVPLIIKDPRRAGGARVRAQAQLVDVLPTVLDLLGLPPPAGAQGSSLVDPQDGTPKGRDGYAFSEAGPGRSMARFGDRKLVRDASGYRLFDLVKDPGEARDLAAERPDLVYEMAQRLTQWLRSVRPADAASVPRTALTPEMKRKLKEAGYWRADESGR